MPQMTVFWYSAPEFYSRRAYYGFNADSQFLYPQEIRIRPEASFFHKKSAGQNEDPLVGPAAPSIILGTIFSGIVTPTEGAGIAVLYVLVVDAIIFRKLTPKDIRDCLKSTASLTSAILLIASASAIMSFIIAMENIPAVPVGLLMAVPGGKIGFLLLMIAFLIMIGMTVDATPACLIFTPLFLPVAVRMGMDPSHFIILMVCGFAIGLTTPPYGVCLFSVASLTKIPMLRLIKSALPFYAVLFITLSLVAFVPEIALFAPRLMGM